MTLAQLARCWNYDQALARADAERVAVLSHREYTFTGHHVDEFTVINRVKGTVYIVHNRANAKLFTCDCSAGADGLYCKHRAVCTRYLADRVQAMLGQVYGALDNLTSTEADPDFDAWVEDQAMDDMQQFVYEMAC
jgi:hypothetical protein